MPGGVDLTRHRPPLLPVAVAAVATFALAAGGTATFEGLGTLPVRPLAAFLLVGAGLHAASRYVTPGVAPRGLAWALWAAGAALSGPLARAPVVGGILAVGLLDLAFAAGDDPEPARGDRSPVLAALVAVSGLAFAAGAALYATSRGPAFRLALTATAGGALAAAYALRPRARTPARLLAGALAFALVFRVLAAPVLPLGPILAYWLLVAAAALALLVGTRAGVGPGLPTGPRRHVQRVRTRRDPLDRGLEPALAAYVDGVASPRRVRRAVAELDPDLAREAAEALPDDASAEARAQALAEALDIPLEDSP